LAELAVPVGLDEWVDPFEPVPPPAKGKPKLGFAGAAWLGVGLAGVEEGQTKWPSPVPTKAAAATPASAAAMAFRLMCDGAGCGGSKGGGTAAPKVASLGISPVSSTLLDGVAFQRSQFDAELGGSIGWSS
jgi:hypothetical protein